MEVPVKLVLTEKSAFHDFEISSCTSGKMEPGRSMVELERSTPTPGTNHPPACTQDRAVETT